MRRRRSVAFEKGQVSLCGMVLGGIGSRMLLTVAEGWTGEIYTYPCCGDSFHAMRWHCER